MGNDGLDGADNEHVAVVLKGCCTSSTLGRRIIHWIVFFFSFPIVGNFSVLANAEVAAVEVVASANTQLQEMFQNGLY